MTKPRVNLKKTNENVTMAQKLNGEFDESSRDIETRRRRRREKNLVSSVMYKVWGDGISWRSVLVGDVNNVCIVGDDLTIREAGRK